jgi:hypothetical protein
VTRLLLGLIVASVCLTPSLSLAYEVDTHAEMGARAVDRSILLSPALSDRLGWSRYETERIFEVPQGITFDDNFRRAYFDALPKEWSGPSLIGIDQRVPVAYDRENMASGIYDGVNYREEGASTIAHEQRLRAWLMRGVIREDDLLQGSYDKEPSAPDADPHGEIIRVLNHFYDPINQSPLSLPLGLSCSSITGGLSTGCARAVDWATGQQNALAVSNQIPNSARRNHFSLADAREAEWCALTKKNNDLLASTYSGMRRLCWATTLKSLGAALHLVQDMAQPQHVRNDAHNPPIEEWYTYFVQTTPERRAYEIYTNWRATGGQEISSPPQETTLFKDWFGKGLAAAPPIANPAYPVPRFALPIEYYTTGHVETGNVNARRGMADFANRNFFSEGTILSSNYPYPPANSSDPSYQIVESTVEVPGMGMVVVNEYTRAVTDSVSPGFIDPVLVPLAGRIPMATRSVWCNGVGVGQAICTNNATISPEQFRIQGDVLIPRAVAYSAGLIDYFFRGRLQVDAPVEGGVLAAVDHGIPHGTDLLGYPHRTDNNAIFGFTKVRLGVRNTTRLNASDTATQTDQPIGNGKLVAIARYHRNPCYRPDLRAEWTRDLDNGQFSVPSGTCSLDELRTDFEELSLSAVVTMPPDINGSTLQTITFDFSADPIPVNVTDLYFQVAFRGDLGVEKDGIAVGRWDAPEPQFLVFHNDTDVHVSSSTWTPSIPPPAVGLTRTDNQPVGIATWNTNQQLFHLNGTLPAGRFVRVAVLGPQTPSSLRLQADLEFGPSNGSDFTFDTLSLYFPRQADSETIAAGVYNPVSFLERRNTAFDVRFPVFKTDGSPRPSLSLMPPLAQQIAMPGIVVIDSALR